MCSCWGLSYYGEHGVPPYVMIIDSDEDQLASSVSVVDWYSRDMYGVWDGEMCCVDNRGKKESEEGRYGAAEW